MSDNYSKLEMALMDLDRAVSGLARQAEGVKKTMVTNRPTTSSAVRSKTGNQMDLFSALGSLPATSDVGLEAIERRLDATIAQIEDLLNDDYAVA